VLYDNGLIYDFGRRENSFDFANSYMIIDAHKGYYPWSLKYDWVTGWG